MESGNHCKNGANPTSHKSRVNFKKINKMVIVMVQHEVKDFAAWKVIFDADEPNRAKEGVKLAGLYTALENPNDVTMVFEAPHAGIFDMLMSDPERQENIKKAGVISAPVAKMFNKV
ncbi:MAG: hypothetical protein IPJ74_13650 [Saprospiraceae bacterium]|nr:hypothetical protein [Saprospiraceae bacterium]